MVPGDLVSLDDINHWKSREYKAAFNSERHGKPDGNAWWSRTKRCILKNTKFQVVQVWDEVKGGAR